MKETAPALHFHYSNPKFAGMPWPKEHARKPGKKIRCVKKPYSREEARTERGRLAQHEPGHAWGFEFCSPCNAFHIVRGGEE